MAEAILCSCCKEAECLADPKLIKSYEWYVSQDPIICVSCGESCQCPGCVMDAADYSPKET